MTDNTGKGKGAPKAAATASGAGSKGLAASADSGAYHDAKSRGKRNPGGPDYVGPLAWSLRKRTRMIMAGKRRYKGAQFFDVRHWASDGTIATGEGVTMPLECVADFARSLLAWVEANLPDEEPEAA